MGAKQECPVMFRDSIYVLLFIEKHLHEGETAGRVTCRGDGQGVWEQGAFPSPPLSGKLFILPAPNQPSVCLGR